MILFGERSLRYVIGEYVEHYHQERNHQGLESRIIRPQFRDGGAGDVECRSRLGGLLNILLPGSSVNNPFETRGHRNANSRGRIVVRVGERSGDQPSSIKEIHRQSDKIGIRSEFFYSTGSRRPGSLNSTCISWPPWSWRPMWPCLRPGSSFSSAVTTPLIFTTTCPP